MSQIIIAILLFICLGMMFTRSLVIAIAPKSRLAKWCLVTFHWADKADVKPQLTRPWVDIESIDVERPIKPTRPRVASRAA